MKVSGITPLAISRDVRRSGSVVSRVLKPYEETKGFEPKEVTGRQRKTTMRDDRASKVDNNQINAYNTICDALNTA
ncbi:---NA--- [Octopus vulgaris]|uniref:---NA n=1 Tax=Octopus vulgaris TaxID=6645 RepID=A0AA36FJ33_OCTVU|nr:---NA--- [Octopus vulgaris]